MITKFIRTTHNLSRIIILHQRDRGGQVLFYDKEFALSKIGEMLWRHRPNFHNFWENPLQFNIDLTKEYIDLIPEGYDYLEVDPMKVLHTEDDIEREEQLIRIFDYLGLDYSILDECMLLCEKYMKDNKNKYIFRTQRN